MARTNHRSAQTKKLQTKKNQKMNSYNMRKRSNGALTIFSGALLGGIAAVAVMLFMVAPMIKTDVASSINHQAVAFKDAANTITTPASDTCSLPAGSGSVTSTSSSTPTTLPSSLFVPATLSAVPAVSQQSSLVTGVYDTGSSAISDTGEKSTNTIATTNVNKTTVTNTNDLTVTNNNPQSASSGTATTSNNVNAGSATTGAATNTSSSNYDTYVNN
jgi:hypothetical protein